MPNLPPEWTPGHFQIWDVAGTGFINIWWWDEYGPKGTPVHRYLDEQLELVPGIEDVEMSRYSVRLEYTSRLRSRVDVAEEIATLLQHDPELRYLAQIALKRPDLQVTVNNLVT